MRFYLITASLRHRFGCAFLKDILTIGAQLFQERREEKNAKVISYIVTE